MSLLAVRARLAAKEQAVRSQADLARGVSRRTERAAPQATARWTLGPWFGDPLHLAQTQIAVDDLITVAGVIGLLAFSVAYLLTLSAAIAVGAGLVAFLTPIVWLDRRRAKRRSRFFAQLPEATSMLATAIRSGRTLRQAFQRVGAGASEPVASAFLEVSRGAERDFPRLAVNRLLQRYPGEELELLAAALAVHRQASASLPDLLERVAHALRARRDAASGAKRHRRVGYALVAASVATTTAVALIVPAAFRFDVYGWVALVVAFSFVAALALIGDLGQSDA